MQAKSTGTGAPRSDRSESECRATRSQAVLLIDTAVSTKEYGSLDACPSCVTSRPDAVLAGVMGRRAEALERSLPKGWLVFHAIHHGTPSIADALFAAQRAGVERLIVLFTRPFFSGTVTGDELRELYRCLAESAMAMHVEVRPWWHDDVAYVDAHARLIHGFALGRGLSPLNSSLAFWAASDGRALAPAELRHFEETAERLRKRLGWPKDRSRTIVVGEDAVTSTPDVGSDTTPTILVSLSHMTSGRRLETDMRRLLPDAGEGTVQAVHTCPCPDASDEFVKVLTQLARRGRLAAGEDSAPPLFADVDPRAIVEREIETLIMAGVCVPSPLDGGQGPELHHCEHDELRKFKRPHIETLDLLRRVAESLGARECFIWNTCSRYELYAFLPVGTTREHRQAMVRRAAAEVFGTGVEYANLLVGRDARHHAVRTAAGLNSALVGDAEVVEQLRAAKAAAQYAGTAGELSGAFIEDIAHAVVDLRGHTGWGEFEHRYCDAALAGLAPTLQKILPNAKCLIVGGSTTSCSALETLAGRFRVPHRNLSLIYRGHRKGALVKRLHAAVGEGSVSVVEEYSEQGVLEAVVEADLVIFAVDQRQPVFTLEAIAKRRAPGAPPLLVFDFNTFGSVEINGAFENVRFIDAATLDAGVKAFNADMLAQPGLIAGVRQAESWITCLAGTAPRRCGGCPSLRSERCPCRGQKALSC